MRYTNKIIAGLLLIAVLYFTTGCQAPKIFGKKASAEAVAKSKVENVENLIGSNLKDKLEQAANLTYGVGYALSKEENPSSAVNVAKDLNSRAASVTGAPTVEEIKKMKQMIDDLTSQLATERERGAKALAEKDDEVYAIQLESKALAIAKDKEIQKYMKIAQDTAMKADAIQAKLDDMNSWGGLGAIWYGIKRLVTRLAWILGIGGILFIFLRVASMSNPIAASIFSIFNVIGSWAINIIKVIVPKAVEMAGHTATGVFNAYRSTLFKVVDAIQMAKEHAKASGGKPDLNAVLDEVAKSMNTDEKAIVDEIKKALNWN